MSESDVRCDRCGYTVGIRVRAGDFCCMTLPTGGYCEGIMQPREFYIARAEFERARKELDRIGEAGP